MRNFEYRIDHEDPIPQSEPDRMLAWLNAQGAEGWELISLYRVSHQGGMLVYLWKREIIVQPIVDDLITVTLNG